MTKQAIEKSVAPRSTPRQYPSIPVSNGESDTYDISGAANDTMLIRMWLSGRPKNTLRAYHSDITGLRLHTSKNIRAMTAADLISYAESLARLATSTQHRKLSTVKSLFSYAHRVGYIYLDPTAALRLPKPPTERASKLLSVEAVRAIIAAAKLGRDRLICRTLYILGLRESELIALKAMNIHPTATGHSVTIQGKGDKSRTLAVPDKLAADLIGHRAEGPVFQTVRDNPMAASDIYRLIKKAGDLAGYRVTPHLLRHAHASHALDAGASLAVVRDGLGHSSLQTTSVYLHAKPSEGSSLYLEDKE